MSIELHFICKHQEHWSPVGKNEFETGNWHVSHATAEEAIGGRIYLHEKQREKAWHGGRVIEFRPSSEAGRFIFKYVVDGDFRIMCRENWGQEQAIIRC